MRITRKQVEGIFEVFIKTIGGHVATAYNDVGGYRLDYVGGYGGYNVERISNAGGGIDQPFGSERRSPSEMWATLHFALRVVEHTQKQAVPK